MDDLQTLLDQQEGYRIPTLESYIQTPKKQEEKQTMMEAVVAALRGQGGAAAPAAGAAMGGSAMPTGGVVNANSGLSTGIDQGLSLAKALKTPTTTTTADYAAYPTGGGLDF